MADVSITYNNSEIATLNDTGSVQLNTSGAVCTDNILVDYTKPAGGASDDVLFIDYDGTVLHQYSKADFLALTEMPANPDHTADGLSAQGWNWTLADAKSYVSDYGMQVIGQVYNTTDDKTHIHITLHDYDDLTVELIFYSVIMATYLTVDWGDGTTPDSPTVFTTGMVLSHTYQTYGNYIISIFGDSYALGGTSTGTPNALNNKNSHIVTAVYLNIPQTSPYFPFIYLSSFSKCSNLKFVTLPQLPSNASASLGSGMFSNCYNLITLTVPHRVYSISNICGTCYNLKFISLSKTAHLDSGNGIATYTAIERIALPDYGSNIPVVWNNSMLTRVAIPNAVTQLSYSFQNTGIREIKLPNTLTVIGSSTFSGCSRLSNIILPSGLQSIGNSAFSDCRQLQSIEVPSTVTTLGTSIFANCTKLSLVKLLNSPTTLPSGMFSGCKSLQDFSIPSSVTTIGNNAFSGTSLYYMEIPNTVQSMGTGVFSNSTLAKIKWNTILTTIPVSTFSGCNELVEFDMPNTVTIIGDSAFAYSPNLARITLSIALTTIDNGAFYSCTSLTSITIPNTVTTIGKQVFRNCTALQTVVLPTSMPTISDQMFYYCSSLPSITLPSDLTTIGKLAFAYCTSMQEYHIQATTPPSIQSDTFQSIPNNCIIYVPYSADHSVVAAYLTATNWADLASYIREEPQ